MDIRVCTTIACTPAGLWAVLEPIERHVEWMADAERITFTTEQTRGVGTTFECLTRVGPLHTTDVMRVTEWEPGSTMGIVHEGVVTGAGRFTLTPVAPDSTMFCWAETLHFPWWMGGRVGERVGRPVLRWVWTRNLRRLRALAEHGH
ncbi:MAG TPA: SRPBCC family protein [Acidimicrobiia bacterium]|nr:SRPBCC family protein [Acidimicrobiia bacterium]